MRSDSDRSDPRHSGKLEGRHVLWMFCAFFGTIFAVNGYFLVSALSTHTGVVSVEPYRKGLAYNERIAASDRQAEQGWSDAVSREPDGALVVSMKDTSGAPLRGLRISGVIGRGASARTDAALDFTDIGDGRYRATPPRLAPGTWVVTVEARRQGEQSEPDYRARRRLWLER